MVAAGHCLSTLLGELSGSLAHELTQPLTAILSNAQAAQRFLARGLADTGEPQEILIDIVTEDKHAGEVIRRLRALLKKGEVQLEPLDMNELVNTVLKLVRSDLVNQNVVVRAELAPYLPAVSGDEVQLQLAWHYIEHDSLPKPETTTLLNLYRRLLNTLTRLYNLLERMQLSRLGKPTVPTVPVDVTISHDGNGDT